MHSAKLMTCLGLVAMFAAGCDSREDRDPSGGAGGVGGSRTIATTAAPDDVDTASGGSRPAASGSGTVAPEVGGSGEPSVAMPQGGAPGGDTSDLGTAGIGPTCGGRGTQTEVVSLEEARARGYDPDALLRKVEGVFEADVRWAHPLSDPETRMRVEIAGDGTVKIVSWDCGEWSRSRDGSRTSCYAGDFIAANLRVSISTTDGRLRGTFPSVVDPVYIEGFDTRVWGAKVGVQEGVAETLIRVRDDGYAILGTLELDSLELDDGGAEVDAGTKDGRPRYFAFFLQLLSAPARDPRINIGFYASGLTSRPAFEALPLDGCAAWNQYYAAGEALPADQHCTAARFSMGSCCGSIAARFPESAYPITEGTNSACFAIDAQDAGLGAVDPDPDSGIEPN